MSVTSRARGEGIYVETSQREQILQVCAAYGYDSIRGITHGLLDQPAFHGVDEHYRGLLSRILSGERSMPDRVRHGILALVDDDERLSFLEDAIVNEQEASAFPESRETRLAYLLNAVTLDPRAVMMVAMSDGAMYTCGDVHRKVETLSGMEFRAPHVYLYYAQQVLIPTGLARAFAGEDRLGRRAQVYELTEDGMKFGVPSAAHALQFAYSNNVSLRSLFGQVNNGELVHGPYKIFRSLEQAAGRELLSDDHDWPRLVERGLAIRETKVKPVYAWSLDRDAIGTPSISRKTLAKRLMEYVGNVGPVPIHDMLESLGFSGDCRGNVSHVLNRLYEQGFVKREELPRVAPVSLTERGRQVLAFGTRIRSSLEDTVVLDHMTHQAQQLIGSDCGKVIEQVLRQYVAQHDDK